MVYFVIPFAIMMAEYGSAFKSERGGIYSWMEKSIGPRYSFIGTFIWYTSWIIWMVSISISIWIPLSNAIFGADTTAKWSLLVLNSTQPLGLIEVFWIITVTYIANKGLGQIAKVSSIGGTAVTLLNILLLVSSVVVLIANGGFAEPVTSQAFMDAPNPKYPIHQSPFYPF